MKWWQSSQSQYERTDGPATHAPGHKIISDMMQLWLSKRLLQSQKYIFSLKEGSPLQFFFWQPSRLAQNSACVCHSVDKTATGFSAIHDLLPHDPAARPDDDHSRKQCKMLHKFKCRNQLVVKMEPKIFSWEFPNHFGKFILKNFSHLSTQRNKCRLLCLFYRAYHIFMSIRAFVCCQILWDLHCSYTQHYPL